MPKYTIQADVIDICSDTPRSGDRFFVDTNAWYWMTYPPASVSAKLYQVVEYPAYIGKAMGAGAKLFQSGLSLSELAHQIEKSKWDVYLAAYGKPDGYGVLQPQFKKYRHDCPAERANVCTEIEAACGTIVGMSDPLPVSISDSGFPQMRTMRTKCVDGYDIFILESMRASGVTQILTDDGDFSTIPGIQVFTANRNVLGKAGAQRKLVKR